MLCRVPLKLSERTPLLDRSWLVSENSVESAPPSAATGAALRTSAVKQIATAAAAIAETTSGRNQSRHRGSSPVSTSVTEATRTAPAVRTIAAQASVCSRSDMHVPRFDEPHPPPI